jgi:hypothetical protein
VLRADRIRFDDEKKDQYLGNDVGGSYSLGRWFARPKCSLDSHANTAALRAGGAFVGRAGKCRIACSTNPARLESGFRGGRADWKLHVAGGNKFDIHHDHCFRLYQHGVGPNDPDSHGRQDQRSA